MPITEFPSPPDLKLKHEQTITDGISINVNPWSVENPHPGFNKDPNIKNEYGHFEYPMWIDSKIEFNGDGSSKRVVVNSAAEHAEHCPVEDHKPVSSDWANG